MSFDLEVQQLYFSSSFKVHIVAAKSVNLILIIFLSYIVLQPLQFSVFEILVSWELPSSFLSIAPFLAGLELN